MRNVRKGHGSGKRWRPEFRRVGVFDDSASRATVEAIRSGVTKRLDPETPTAIVRCIQGLAYKAEKAWPIGGDKTTIELLIRVARGADRILARLPDHHEQARLDEERRRSEIVALHRDALRGLLWPRDKRMYVFVDDLLNDIRGGALFHLLSSQLGDAIPNAGEKVSPEQIATVRERLTPIFPKLSSEGDATIATALRPYPRPPIDARRGRGRAPNGTISERDRIETLSTFLAAIGITVHADTLERDLSDERKAEPTE
jgi:hypothetical protein